MKLKIYLAAHAAAAAALELKTRAEVVDAEKSAFTSAGFTSKQDFDLFNVYFEDELNKMRGIASGKSPSEIASQTV